MPQKRYLLTPGPTPVPPEVLAALAEPVIHHRSPDFKVVFERVMERLGQVFRTENEILLFTSSGTGAFESAVMAFLKRVYWKSASFRPEAPSCRLWPARIADAWRRGTVAVVGLGKSGVAATRLLAREGVRVYASDASDHPYGGDALATLRALPGVTVDVGRHDLARIRSAAAVIVSPGVPPDAPPLAAAREARVPILSEIDLGFRALAASGGGTRIIAITGTNGKTTTTALVAHLLRVAGLSAEAVGNIGRPLADVVLQGDHYQWLAVEVSSFQLHDSPHFAPAIGVVTNLAPDHLDRYPAVEAYYADKRLLFQNASDGDVWILNGDDAAVLDLAAGARGRRALFSLRRPADGWYDPSDRRLRLGGHPLLPRDELVLLGDHNVANALAAALAVHEAGLSPGVIGEGLRVPRRPSFFVGSIL